MPIFTIICCNFAETKSRRKSMEKGKAFKIPICTTDETSGLSIELISDIISDTEFDNSKPHLHSFYEILWFQDGEGVHNVDFVDYKVKPNTLFFLSPGQVHNFDRCNGYEGISIKLCTDFMKNEDETGNLFLKYNMFHNYDTSPCFYINETTAYNLWRLVENMELECRDMTEFGTVDILQALIRIFLIRIHRYDQKIEDVHLDSLKPSHLLFVNFRSMVDKEYMRVHTVQEYADRLHVAVRTLNKCVNDCAGLSPLAYINNRIILEAKRLIRYTNMMIKEIAAELGYDDASYFIKLFKRKTGYMPSEFRDIDNITQCKL